MQRWFCSNALMTAVKTEKSINHRDVFTISAESSRGSPHKKCNLIQRWTRCSCLKWGNIAAMFTRISQVYDYGWETDCLQTNGERVLRQQMVTIKTQRSKLSDWYALIDDIRCLWWLHYWNFITIQLQSRWIRNLVRQSSIEDYEAVTIENWWL